MQDRNMQAILEKWGFKRINSAGRVIDDEVEITVEADLNPAPPMIEVEPEEPPFDLEPQVEIKR